MNKEKLKKEYIGNWLNSDCPKPWDSGNKQEYKEAKQKYIKEKHNIKDYLIKRYEYFKNKDSDLANLYLNYPEIKEYLKNIDDKPHQLDLEYQSIITPK